MTEIRAKISDMTYTLNGEAILSLTIQGDGRALYDEYKNKDLNVAFKQYRAKRSLDANSYFWVLCNKLAEKTRLPKDEIYRSAIKNIGGNCYTSPVLLKEKDNAIKMWESHGLGWVCEDTGSSKLEGCTNIIFYAGSSFYDTEQMSRLIDNIVQDCKAVGIETMTPEQLQLLKEEWR
jgi:hypothetical protein